MRDYLALLILPAFIIGGVLETLLPTGVAFAVTVAFCAAAVLIFVLVTDEN